MRYVVVSLALQCVAQALLFLGNFDNAWRLDNHHGGIWRFCVSQRVGGSNQTHCSTYKEDTAEHYNHSFSLVIASRNFMLATAIMGSPIIIVSSFGLCADFNFGPYALICICTVSQLACSLALGGVMTYCFITLPSNGTQLDFALWSVWSTAVPIFIIFVLMSLRTAALYRQEFPHKKPCCCGSKTQRRSRTSSAMYLEAGRTRFARRSLSIVGSYATPTHVRDPAITMDQDNVEEITAVTKFQEKNEDIAAKSTSNSVVQDKTEDIVSTPKSTSNHE